jgi:hypothetical protein
MKVKRMFTIEPDIDFGFSYKIQKSEEDVIKIQYLEEDNVISEIRLDPECISLFIDALEQIMEY